MFIGLISLVLTEVVSAASFDCSKASLVAEKLICADPILSVADEALDAAYRSHLQRLSLDARGWVIEAQRAWIGWWPQYCSSDAGSIRLAQAQLNCAREIYRTRLQQLEAKTVLGVPVYFRAHFAALSAYKSSNGVFVRPLHSIQISQLDSAGLDERSLRLIEAVNEWIRSDLATWDKVSSDALSDTEKRVSVRRVSPELLQTVATGSYYGHGAAHELPWEQARHFMLRERREMHATDFFSNEAFVRAAGDLVYATLLDQQGAESLSFFVEDFALIYEAVNDVNRWRLEPNGLSVFFNVYEVASFAEGPQTITIPWLAIERYATSFGLSQIAAMRRVQEVTRRTESGTSAQDRNASASQ